MASDCDADHESIGRCQRFDTKINAAATAHRVHQMSGQRAREPGHQFRIRAVEATSNLEDRRIFDQNLMIPEAIVSEAENCIRLAGDGPVMQLEKSTGRKSGQQDYLLDFPASTNSFRVRIWAPLG